MQRHSPPTRILPILTVAFVVLFATTPASAGELVSGDDFSFRLPSGFKQIGIEELPNGDEAQQAMQVVNGFSGELDRMDIRFFARYDDADQEPDALMAIVVFAFPDSIASQMGNMPPISAFEQQFRLQFERGMQMGGIEVEDYEVNRVTLKGGQEALELIITAEDPDKGELATARVLFMFDKKIMLMVAFQGLTRNALVDDPAWAAVTSSFKVDSRPDIVRFALKYWPFLLGGVVLLFTIVLLKRSGGGSQPKRPSIQGASSWDMEEEMPPAEAGSLSRPVGTSLSRPLDGLPMYGGQPGMMEREEVEEEAQAPLGSLGPPRVGAPGGLRPPTVPRSAESPGRVPVGAGVGGEAAAPAPGGLRRPGAGPAAPSGNGGFRPPEPPGGAPMDPSARTTFDQEVPKGSTAGIPRQPIAPSARGGAGPAGPAIPPPLGGPGGPGAKPGGLKPPSSGGPQAPVVDRPPPTDHPLPTEDASGPPPMPKPSGAPPFGGSPLDGSPLDGSPLDGSPLDGPTPGGSAPAPGAPPPPPDRPQPNAAPPPLPTSQAPDPLSPPKSPSTPDLGMPPPPPPAASMPPPPAASTPPPLAASMPPPPAASMPPPPAASPLPTPAASTPPTPSNPPAPALTPKPTPPPPEPRPAQPSAERPQPGSGPSMPGPLPGMTPPPPPRPADRPSHRSSSTGRGDAVLPTNVAQRGLPMTGGGSQPSLAEAQGSVAEDGEHESNGPDEDPPSRIQQNGDPEA